MKLRFLVMGTIITVLGLALTATKGWSGRHIALGVIGVVLLVLGALWK